MKKISVLPERKRKVSVNMQPSCMQICNLHATFMYVIVPFRRFFALNASLVCIWFKLSASIYPDYKKVERKLGLLAHKFLEHVESRWFTLASLLLEIVEQVDGLKQYVFFYVSGKQNILAEIHFFCSSCRYFMCCFERIIR